ncbi:hypothetical protein TNCV_2299941 [Trichonephila clavipes]|nr:hypothetical protein TNCV_2299941 [Trichonephila clavipes]
MENLSDDQSVIMEEIDPQNITDEQKCNNLKSIDKQIKIFTARKDYIRTVLNIEKSIPGPTNETSQKLEAEVAGLDEKIRALESGCRRLQAVDGSAELSCFVPTDELSCFVPAAELSCSFLLLS